VDFEIEGLAIWRGGYNSGKIKSINNLYLDLECGINRVSIRASRTPGAITVRARCEGLKPGSITIESKPVEVANGFTTMLPALPVVPLLKERIVEVKAADTIQQTQTSSSKQPQSEVGRFTKAFSYSGPTGIVHLEQNAKDGKNVYVDRDYPFVGLAAELNGADWIQAANGDSLYNAVDLMEITAKAGTVVSIAHDDRLPRPSWLTRQFKPTDLSIAIANQPMKVFHRRIERDESLTLGANTEDPGIKAANMYIVFVNGSLKSR
jgi:beta-galactosidase